MADIYGSYFTYGNISSSDYGLILSNVESTRFVQVAGTIAGVTIFNKSGKRNYLIDDDYSGSPLSFEIDIVTDDGCVLTREQRHAIEKWLFNRHSYRKLYPAVSSHCSQLFAGSLQLYASSIVGKVPGVSNIDFEPITVGEMDEQFCTTVVYLKLASGYSASNYTVTVDGEPWQTLTLNSRMCIKLTPVRPNEYDRNNVITVTNGTDTLTITCSPLSCAYAVLSSGSSSDADIEEAISVYDAFAANENTEYIDGVAKRQYLNCRFINPSYLEYQGGIVGYRATLEADCGYWWQDAITKTFTLDHQDENSSTLITVNVDTDIDDYTYPRVTVVMNSSGGDFSIMNNTDDSARLTSFTDVAAGATVVVDSGFNYVSDQYYLKFYNQNFPRLLDGDNAITVRGAVQSITFTFNNRRNFL